MLRAGILTSRLCCFCTDSPSFGIPGAIRLWNLIEITGKIDIKRCSLIFYCSFLYNEIDVFICFYNENSKVVMVCITVLGVLLSTCVDTETPRDQRKWPHIKQTFQWKTCAISCGNWVSGKYKRSVCTVLESYWLATSLHLDGC